MKTMINKLLLVPMAFVVSVSAAQALTLKFDDLTTVSSNSPHTGAAGLIDLAFSDVSMGIVLVTGKVTNTTGQVIFGDGATASKLTGFGHDFLDGTSLNTIVSLGSFLDTHIAGADFNPYGDLDIGFADNNKFLGGGANDALPENMTDNFSYSLNALGFTAVTLEAAMAAAFDDGLLQAGLRFQQVEGGLNNDASDKLDYIGLTPVPAVPLPAGGLLLLSALGIMGLRRKLG